MDRLVGWLAPIISTLVICAGQLALNSRFKRADEKRDQARAETQAKRDAEAEWRGRIEKRLDGQDEDNVHAQKPSHADAL